MSVSAPTVRRAVAGTFATAVISGATLFGSAAIAAADPPPDCTAADLARIQSGVSAATSDYMFTHPDVNAFFTGLKGQDRDWCAATRRTTSTPTPRYKLTFKASVSRWMISRLAANKPMRQPTVLLSLICSARRKDDCHAN